MKDTLYCFSPHPSLDFRCVVGSGSFGTVFKAYDNNRKKYVAVKRSIKVGQIISREYKILKEISGSEYCIDLLDIFYTVNKNNEFIQHLVFDFMPDNLCRVLRTRNKLENLLSNAEIHKVMHQLLKGIEYIHSKNIMHRDIKPENILINPSTFDIKICDLGSAKTVDETENVPYVVSRFYRAPELILACRDYGKEVDIWAAGCIFIELHTGTPIFPGASDGDQLLKQLSILGRIPSTSPIIQKSPLSKDLISSLLKIGKKTDLIESFERSSKPSLAADLALKMLQYNPKDRLSACECLSHEYFKDDIKVIKSSN